MTCHDRCLELAAHHIAEIRPIMSRLRRIAPEDVEIGQSVLVHHIVEIVVGAPDKGLDSEGLGNFVGSLLIAWSHSTREVHHEWHYENADWSHGFSPGSLLAIIAFP